VGGVAGQMGPIRLVHPPRCHALLQSQGEEQPAGPPRPWATAQPIAPLVCAAAPAPNVTHATASRMPTNQRTATSPCRCVEGIKKMDSVTHSSLPYWLLPFSHTPLRSASAPPCRLLLPLLRPPSARCPRPRSRNPGGPGLRGAQTARPTQIPQQRRPAAPPPPRAHPQWQRRHQSRSRLPPRPCTATGSRASWPSWTCAGCLSRTACAAAG
jgi:hypothetical protein